MAQLHPLRIAVAGAGAIGEYSRCAWTSTGEGTFTPSDAATPAIGRAGEAARVVELVGGAGGGR